MGMIVSLRGAEGLTGAGMGARGVGARTDASEGAQALAFRDPGNVIEGSSGF